MATVYGDNRTKALAMSPTNLLEPEVAGATVRWVYDQYTAAALAGGSVIELGIDLPAEARIVDWVIDTEALASAIKAKFGTADDDDEFMAYVDFTAADRKNATDDGVSQSLGFKINAGDGQTLIITTSGTSTATGTIKVAVAYTVKS